MSTRRGVAGLAVGLALCAAALPAGGARADGDPASDVLLSQDVYLPYSGISTTLQRQLFAVCSAAQRAGYPVRIALIAAQSDLGVVPALFNKPQAYARFLSAELGGVVHGPVLVVMPAGVGLASQGRALSTGSLGTPSALDARSGGPDALASAAAAAVPRLAAAAGHPLPASATSSSSRGSGASAGTVRDALIALVVLGLLAGAAIAGAFVARSRREDLRLG